MTPQAAQTALTEMARPILASSAGDGEVMALIEANDDAPAPLRLPEDAAGA
jgi:hypothetical protein